MELNDKKLSGVELDNRNQSDVELSNRKQGDAELNIQKKNDAVLNTGAEKTESKKTWKPVSMERHMLKAVAKLDEDYYGPDNDISIPSYLEYEYFDTPYGDAFVKVAWNDELKEAEAQFAMVPYEIRIRGEEYPVVMAANTISSPNYRGMPMLSISKDLMKDVKNSGTPLAYATPNIYSYPIVTKFLKFKEVENWPLLVKPLTPSNMVRDYLGSKPLSLLSKIANPFFKVKEDASSNVNLVRLDYDTLDLADRFWERIKDKYPIMLKRGSKYIKHRLLDNPRRDYLGYYATIDGTPVAFAVGRNMRISNLSCALIGDFLYIDGFEKEAKSLMLRLLTELNEMGGDMAGGIFPPHSKEYGLLKGMGFFKSPKVFQPQPFRQCVKSYDESITETVENKNNWFFTLSDYDIF